ncbi:MAG: hypothetical protein QOD75_3541 [Blastocatellia bacterium]|jgi:hypothetical protein|nr:hypothetical protein [Blastocatellia bacterium]
MKPALHNLSLPGAMLARGFWLYVWEVTDRSCKQWLYVGRTGDSSSPSAQSPFARLSQHLGSNQRGNALRRNLKRVGIDADHCRSFELTCYGPILPECADMIAHAPSRDIMAGLEKGLRNALHMAGYRLLNEVKSRHPIDKRKMAKVLQAFSGRFNKLLDGGVRTSAQ